MPDLIKAKRDALNDLKTMIAQFGHQVPQIFDRVNSGINDLGEKLVDRENYWIRQVSECERALSNCRSSGAPDAPPPDCSYYVRALEHAIASLDQVRKLRARTYNAVQAYKPYEARLNAVAERSVHPAISFLYQHILHIEQYGQ